MVQGKVVYGKEAVQAFADHLAQVYEGGHQVPEGCPTFAKVFNLIFQPLIGFLNQQVVLVGILFVLGGPGSWIVFPPCVGLVRSGYLPDSALVRVFA